MTNLDRFMLEYIPRLEADREKHPADYFWSPSARIAAVEEKMRAAIDAGSFNKNSRAIRATCKALGIPYTYSAIRTFVRGI